MRILILSVLITCLQITGVAQEVFQASPRSLDNLTALRKVVSQSFTTGAVAYDMIYRISTITEPDLFVDSAVGNCKYLGKKCWYSIGGMEVLQDTAITVVVFEEDQLIYLTKSTTMQAGFNALGLLDSLLTGKQHLNCTYTKESGVATYRVVFSRPVLYKELVFKVDKAGRLIATRQIVNQSLMSGGVQATGISGDWLVLDIQFSNWNTSSAEDPVFNLSHYLKTNAEGYLAADRLAAYSVFIAHPTL